MHPKSFMSNFWGAFHKKEFRIFYFIHLQNEENYERKESSRLDEVLSKEFISQFKTEADVSKFLKQLHAQVLEKMLEGEMDAHLGYEKNSVAGNNSGNSRNGRSILRHLSLLSSDQLLRGFLGQSF